MKKTRRPVVLTVNGKPNLWFKTRKATNKFWNAWKGLKLSRRFGPASRPQRTAGPSPRGKR